MYCFQTVITVYFLDSKIYTGVIGETTNYDSSPIVIIRQYQLSIAGRQRFCFNQRPVNPIFQSLYCVYVFSGTTCKPEHRYFI